MSERGVQRLAAAWQQAQVAYDAGSITEAQWKSIFAVQSLAGPHKKPQLLWEVICEVLRTSPPLEVEEILAAGPLEDLICVFGAEMLERIEVEASRNPRFASLLPRVWIRKADDEVTRRYIELG